MKRLLVLLWILLSALLPGCAGPADIPQAFVTFFVFLVIACGVAAYAGYRGSR